MHLINMSKWVAKRVDPSNPYCNDYVEERTFQELHFTFLPLATALMLIKEQEQLYIRHRASSGHTWTITGITEIPYNDNLRSYESWEMAMRQSLDGLNAFEVTSSFNVDWLNRNVD